MFQMTVLWVLIVGFFCLTPEFGFSMDDSQDGQVQAQDQEAASSSKDSEGLKDDGAANKKKPKKEEREEDDEDDGLGICPGGVCVPDGELKDE